MPDENIALAVAPREFADLTDDTVSYNRLYKAVLDGIVPAHRVGSRWFIRRSDRPAIVSALGLTPKVATRASRKTSVAPTSVAA